MSKNIMDNLFGSRVRVKVLKFLFRNHPQDFDVTTLVDRTQESRAVIRRELEMLREIQLVKKKH